MTIALKMTSAIGSDAGQPDVPRGNPFNPGSTCRVSRVAHGLRLAASARGRGVTLIEVLTVMGIILFLAGVVATAAFTYLRRAQVKGTEGFMRTLGHALDMYREEHRMYVPHTDIPSNFQVNAGDEGQLRASTYVLWYALEREGRHLSTSVDHRVKNSPITSADTMSDPQTGGVIELQAYQDAWKTLLLYECVPPYTSYMLRSAGRDKVFEFFTDPQHKREACGDDLVEGGER